MKSINELVQRAHSNAVNKGWWDEDRSFGEIINLIISEASEALEDYRKGNNPGNIWYDRRLPEGGLQTVLKMEYDTDKPCGIPSELADIVIRICDVAGRYDWGTRLDEAYLNLQETTVATNQVDESLPFAENLTIIQSWLIDAYRAKSEPARITYLALAMEDTFRLASFYEIDMDKSITEKMAYNATRPRRHGGKVL